MITAPADTTLDPASFRAIADLAYRERRLTPVVENTPLIQARLPPPPPSVLFKRQALTRN